MVDQDNDNFELHEEGGLITSNLNDHSRDRANSDNDRIQLASKSSDNGRLVTGER